MDPSVAAERRRLQIAIALAGIVPVVGGAVGIVAPSWLLELNQGCGATCDSHVRYLSGLLLGIGLAAWSMAPRVERCGRELMLLTALVAVGGLARLFSLFSVGAPSKPMLGGLLMELVATPLLCLWQIRVARRVAAAERT